MNKRKAAIELKKKYRYELIKLLNKFRLNFFEKPGFYFIYLTIGSEGQVIWTLVYSENVKDLIINSNIILDVGIPKDSKISVQKIKKLFLSQFMDCYEFS